MASSSADIIKELAILFLIRIQIKLGARIANHSVPLQIKKWNRELANLCYLTSKYRKLSETKNH